LPRDRSRLAQGIPLNLRSVPNVVKPAYLLLLFCLQIASQLALGQDQPPLQRDLMTLATLFPGTYDNMEQVCFAGRLNLPEAERHQRLRTEV
jgi:hypothetical protein